MSKRGQLTLFIIIGIILVFSTAVIIYLQQQVETAGFEGDELSAFSNEVQPVKLFVDKCLADVAIPGIYYMGTQGGYISPPLESLLTESSVIPYYYNKGTNSIPTLAALENQLADHIEASLPICTDRFKQFPHEITEGEIRATVKILDQRILVKAFYPVTVKLLDGTEETAENFALDIPIRMGHIYDVAKSVVERQVADPEKLDLAYLSSFDVAVDVLPYDGSTNILAITDARSSVENVRYQFFFANNYAFNSDPSIDFTPDFVLKTGIRFNHTITAVDPDDDLITFTDDSQLFDISPDGRITFTPVASGVVTVIITANDGKGGTDSEAIRLEIQ
ncbi:MAG TPA: Ig-like domain-containing protein [Candidatus Nanoarchaeia archaeon]|nr:Ig-like domain-containing protein [Candidatus Nanoarchaeia archaeon]